MLLSCPELCDVVVVVVIIIIIIIIIMSSVSVDQIFREANVSPGGQVQYQDFVKIACAPVPDYY